jgi:hypothetical protein
MSKTKRNSLLFFSTAGIFVLILAMSLPNLVLAPGQSFSLGKSQAEDRTETNDPFPGGNELEWMIRGILALAILLLPLYIAISLLTPEGRQRFMADVIIITALLLLAFYLDKHPLSESNQQQEPAVSSAADQEMGSEHPTEVFSEDPPSWLAAGIVLVASVLAVVFIFAVIWFFKQRSKRPDRSLRQLAEAAQSAIESLQTGGNFEVTVIRCYHEMSREVKEKRGITREIAMTPREFEERLVSKELPREAVQTLTRLFEQVRYGSMPPGQQEERLALACLTDIANACKTMGVRHDKE